MTENREKQYREPILPDDHGKPARFSDTLVTWTDGTLCGWWSIGDDDDTPWIDGNGNGYQYCVVEDVE
jgi:hypothetical protein